MFASASLELGCWCLELPPSSNARCREDSVSGGLLPQRQRPKPVAMPLLTLSRQPNMPARCHLFLDAADVRAQLVVAHEAQAAVFEIRPQTEGQFFFYRGGKGDR